MITDKMLLGPERRAYGMRGWNIRSRAGDAGISKRDWGRDE
jgi:hypothetical protein